MAALGCFSCKNTLDPSPPPREAIVRTDHWRVAHAFDTALPGWLVIVPTEHILSLDELSSDAAVELGPLLRNLTRGLIAVTGCEKTYVMLIAEKQGFSHLHFHVVPRLADLSDQYQGPNIFGLLGASGEKRVSDQDQDRIASRLSEALGTNS